MQQLTTLNTESLKEKYVGAIILPGNELYETARVTYAFKDSRPAIIVQPSNTADIAAALSFAQENSLPVSVRSGGHGVAEFSTNNDGLVLDMSQFNSIEVLDEKKGLVRLGSGATWGDAATELAKYNLALSSGDTKTVGVGGLTLGGGIGWMVRKYGFAVDSLVGAEVVLADGSVVQANESEHPDLFWALRGGGGNFGVVTHFDFQAHPVEKIVVNTVTYGVDTLQEALAGWRDHMRTAPEDLTSFLTLMPSFPGFEPSVMVMSCYAGSDLGKAEEVMEPLRHLGEAVSDDTKTIPYPEILEDAHPPEGLKFIVKNMFIKTLDDDLIRLISDMCCKPGSPVVQLRIMHGTIDTIAPEATAIPHRNNEAFLFAGFPVPPDASEEQEARALQSWNMLAPYASGMYCNFVSTNTKDDVATIYPEHTYQRLAKIKHTYDPKNIFRHNFNVEPANDD